MAQSRPFRIYHYFPKTEKYNFKITREMAVVLVSTCTKKPKQKVKYKTLLNCNFKILRKMAVVHKATGKSIMSINYITKIP
jgi:hypothetical protein